MNSEVKQSSLPNLKLNSNADYDLCKACRKKYFNSIYQYPLNDE